MLNQLEVIQLLNNGQIVIPQAIRQMRQWESGQEFTVEETAEGVLIRPVASVLPRTTVADVAGFLKYEGDPISIEEMDLAIDRAIREQWNESD